VSHGLYQSAEGIFITVNQSYRISSRSNPSNTKRMVRSVSHDHFKESCIGEEKPLDWSIIIDKSSSVCLGAVLFRWCLI
jgi:hypothetical protein